MRMYDIINNKRRGMALTGEEIEFFVRGYTEGNIPDYQASALAMAIVLVGMNDREIADLTMSMAKSGETVDLSMFGDLTVDKHSTGGVGDKTTLIVAPTVAAIGAKVAKMSGRGLGHTGGTIDKLESIPGFKTSLEPDEFFRQVKKIGIAVIGQTGNLAPCDKRLYALRDVTATVESIPLITSSIMSKKIAAGTHSIVLDVKTGSGAFMKIPDDAIILGEKMVEIGKKCGRNMAAIVTDMNTPLGNAVGNALEVKEAMDVLKGESKGDLREVCEALASNMVSLSLGYSIEESKTLVSAAIDSGKAYEKFEEWVSAQGGDLSSFTVSSAFSYEIKSEKSGYISFMDAEKIGLASVILGAGRASKDDTIDMTAGIILSKKTGDFVNKGEAIAILKSSSKERIKEAEKVFTSAITLSEQAPPKKPLIYKIIR